jgi:hypothetical protein
MGEQADRIDTFSDDKIIEMNEKWREQRMEEFRTRWARSSSEHPDWCGKF